MNPTLAVIPAYLTELSDLELLTTAIRTLRETTSDCDLLVVDDGSPNSELVDLVSKLCHQFDFDFIAKPENSGFAQTVNVGLLHALEMRQDALLVNADVEFVDNGWLDRMRRQETSAGGELASVVGARLLYPTGLIQHGGVFFSLLTRTFGHIHQFGPGDLPEAQFARVCPVTAALQLIRHECLTEVGVYDDGFQMGHEDVDYCLRVFDSGRECVYQPTAWAYHHESVFRGRPSPKIQDWQLRSFIRLMEKHRGSNFARWVPTF